MKIKVETGASPGATFGVYPITNDGQQLRFNHDGVHVSINLEHAGEVEQFKVIVAQKLGPSGVDEVLNDLRAVMEKVCQL